MARRRLHSSEEDWDGGEEEYQPLEIPPEYRNLEWEETRISIREIWERFLKQEIILEPDFQRHYVWDVTRASRYIESLLLGLPTPALFVSEERDGRWVVIDGHQRLETLFRYMQPLLRGTTLASGTTMPRAAVFPALALQYLEVIPTLNGTDITALSMEDRRKLWDTKLTLIRLPRSVHPDMKYVLFARLNQGSMSLNNQELRNCLYRGSYNRLIARLSEDRDFLRLWGRSAPDKRMRHRELLLRFFALLHRRPRYRIPFRAFLNDEMSENQNVTPEEEMRFRTEFDLALRWVERVFGTEVFRLFRIGNEIQPAGRWERRRYDLLYEVEMAGFAQSGEALDKIWDQLSLREQQLLCMIIRHRLVDVMLDNRFLSSLNEGTTRPGAVHTRFDLWNQAISAIVQDPRAALYAGSLLHQRLSQSNICGLCPNPLIADDAVWITSDGDTKLVHRFCRGKSSIET